MVQSDHGYDIILYYDAGPMDVELASEFGGLDKDNANLNKNIMREVLEKFPDKKINTVKIMVGAVLAGEQGKGFVVVADEVKKLAQSNTNSKGYQLHYSRYIVTNKNSC